MVRIIQAGRIPVPIIQRYYNKWLPTSFDLFGTDHSSSAQWSYVWGLKGRYNERDARETADKEHLNEASRELYRDEVQKLTDSLNKLISEDQPKLVVPHLSFNRQIGEHRGKLCTVAGEPLSAEQYQGYLPTVLPSEADKETLRSIMKEKDWIVPKKPEELVQ